MDEHRIRHNYDILFLSIIILAIKDLKRKPPKHNPYHEGCPKRAYKFIMSRNFLKICEAVDLDGEAIRELIKYKSIFKKLKKHHYTL